LRSSCQRSAPGNAGVSPAVSRDREKENGGPNARAPKDGVVEPKGWYSRGYLPHFDSPYVVQSIGFRLADAVPLQVVEMWKQQLHMDRHTPASDPRMIGLRRRIDRYEDAGHGSCVLRDARVAAITENALLHFDRERYRLIAWCVMPNHVHAMVELHEGFTLPNILHSWKSYTAKEINKILRERGQLWLEEYHDRYIRNERHFHTMVAYIENNPVKAGLCREARDWRFSSAKFKSREDGGRDARVPR
jgi:REP element-mobilizing transposase RayT